MVRTIVRGEAATAEGQGMLRFLLLRFLPRRLMPLLFLFQVFRLLRQWQNRDVRPLPRNVTPRDVTPREVTPGGVTRNG